MNHPSPDQLRALLLDELSDAEQRALAEHMERCSDCAAALQAEARVELALYEAADARAQGRRPAPAPTSTPRHRVARAALALAAAAALWALFAGPSPQRPELAQGDAPDEPPLAVNMRPPERPLPQDPIRAARMGLIAPESSSVPRYEEQMPGMDNTPPPGWGGGP